jgi:hypothetical protein
LPQTPRQFWGFTFLFVPLRLTFGRSLQQLICAPRLKHLLRRTPIITIFSRVVNDANFFFWINELGAYRSAKRAKPHIAFVSSTSLA